MTSGQHLEGSCRNRSRGVKDIEENNYVKVGWSVNRPLSQIQACVVTLTPNRASVRLCGIVCRDKPIIDDKFGVKEEKYKRYFSAASKNNEFLVEK